MRVLVIDDDHTVRLTLKAVLEIDNHEVLLAEDGKQGLELFAAEHPDLVLTDLIMPVLDGLQVIASIRAGNDSLPIVVTTGGERSPGGGADKIARARELGADAVLRKPFDPDDLLAMIASYRPAAAE
jgi:CheY-like chemotaxis protein